MHRWVLEFKRESPQALKMNHVVDVQKVQQHQKSLSNFDIVCKDPSLTKREIADTIGISDERVLYILHEVHMKKLFGKLVPHSLTIQQKLNRKQISQRNLKRFKQNQTDFVRRFITMDETWIPS